MNELQALKKKCWDDLMAVIQHGLLFLCTMLIGVMLSMSLLDLLTLFSGRRGGIWVEEGFKLYAHYCLEKKA